ncbi:MAG: hypothetical protein GOV02_01935 [Candidatus Aenigmarchaeota archaeon]|nr:hypothetical protein [Candidatus Aenigmarchaeota archaeon]
MAAISWSSGIFQQNVDSGKVMTAENFMFELDSSIQSVIRHGGSESINYNIDGTIGLLGSEYNDAIEVKTPVTIGLPNYWINITRTDSLGSIREILDGNILRIELTYPERNDYIVDMYTEGSKVSTPDIIIIEKTGITEYQGKTVIRIKLTFQ